MNFQRYFSTIKIDLLIKAFEDFAKYQATGVLDGEYAKRMVDYINEYSKEKYSANEISQELNSELAKRFSKFYKAKKMQIMKSMSLYLKDEHTTKSDGNEISHWNSWRRLVAVSVRRWTI